MQPNKECFESLHVFYPTEGIYVILEVFFNFLLHFLPSKNPLGIFDLNFFLLNYT